MLGFFSGGVAGTRDEIWYCPLRYDEGSGPSLGLVSLGIVFAHDVARGGGNKFLPVWLRGGRILRQL